MFEWKRQLTSHRFLEDGDGGGGGGEGGDHDGGGGFGGGYGGGSFGGSDTSGGFGTGAFGGSGGQLGSSGGMAGGSIGGLGGTTSGLGGNISGMGGLSGTGYGPGAFGNALGAGAEMMGQNALTGFMDTSTPEGRAAVANAVLGNMSFGELAEKYGFGTALANSVGSFTSNLGGLTSPLGLAGILGKEYAKSQVLGGAYSPTDAIGQAAKSITQNVTGTLGSSLLGSILGNSPIGMIGGGLLGSALGARLHEAMAGRPGVGGGTIGRSPGAGGNDSAIFSTGPTGSYGTGQSQGFIGNSYANQDALQQQLQNLMQQYQMTGGMGMMGGSKFT